MIGKQPKFTTSPFGPAHKMQARSFSKIAEKLPGAEGPVFTPDGNFYMVAPEVEKDGKSAGQILRVDLAVGTATVFCEPKVDDWGGIPAGLQSDKKGHLWVADMRLGILHVTPDGSFEQVAKVDSSGEVMQGCNDCTFDYDGNLWITAPAGKIAPQPYMRSMEEPFGSVYCLTREGKVIKVDSGYQFSNGIAVQHMDDGRPKTLIVAETPTKTLWAYDITGPGLVQNKRVWGKLPGEHTGGPDGMDFDSARNLLVANWGSSHVEVFGSTGGEPIHRIQCPFEKPSNLHFRPASSEVYITEHDSHGLWKFIWGHEGRKEFADLVTF